MMAMRKFLVIATCGREYEASYTVEALSLDHVRADILDAIEKGHDIGEVEPSNYTIYEIGCRMELDEERLVRAYVQRRKVLRERTRLTLEDHERRTFERLRKKFE